MESYILMKKTFKDKVRKRLSACDSGATALEFAILAPVFFVVLFSIIEIGYHALIQSDLDGLSYNFTMSMAISDDNGMDKQQVINDILCAQKTVFVKCENVTVGIDAYDRFAFFDPNIMDDFTTRWKTGCGGMTIITQLNYPTTNFVLPFVFGDIIMVNGKKHHRARGMVTRELTLVGNGQTSVTMGSSGETCST